MTDAIQIQCSPAIATLCFHLPSLCADLSALLDAQRSSHERERLEALVAYCDYGYLARFEVLDASTRKLIYESIMACCRAKIGARPTRRLRAYRATIIRSIHDCRGEVYVHGLAKKHAPETETWKHDAQKKLSSLQNLLNRTCVSQPMDEPRPPSPPSSPDRDIPRNTQRDLFAILEALAAAFPERLVVLPTAFTSARDAADFRSPEQAGSLMRRLVEEYLPLFEEYGDEIARRVFTDNQFAAKESRTSRHNARALQTHTFDYNGRLLLFWKHLRIGNGESSRDCWRCYFHHDQERGAIVIAHCGAHLALR